MQPQDTGFDWSHGITGLLSGAFGAITGFIASVWRVARIEPTIRLDFRKELNETEDRLGEEIKMAKHDSAQKVDDMIGQLHETFNGIRRQIDEIEKETLPRGDFNMFRQEMRADAEQSRKENREDFAKLERKIDEMMRRRQ